MSTGQLDDQVLVTQHLGINLNSWMFSQNIQNGVVLLNVHTSQTLATDSSNEGWGHTN